MSMTAGQKKREQMKGYTQAVQDMTAIMEREAESLMTSINIAMEKLESEMRGNVLKRVEQMDVKTGGGFMS